MQRLGKENKKIKILGFLSDSELHNKMLQASVFVNPRPSSFGPNQLNFPSKLLLYIAYEKPVISTFTAGISPEYTDIISFVEHDTVDGLRQKLEEFLELEENKKTKLKAKILVFKEKHSWNHQTNKYLLWLKNWKQKKALKL